MMKKAYMLAVLFLIQFLFSSCASRNAETMKSFRDLCPEKKVGICYFKLSGADAEKNAQIFAGVFVAGLVGGLVVAGVNANREDDAYSQELAREFQHIYEEELGKSGFFQFSSSKNMIFQQDGKPIKLEDMANKNNLDACVNAVSFLGARVGLNKRVVVNTAWEVTKPSGEKLKFTTKAISEEGQGVFPDTADPKLKPVFVQLARESVQQFIEQMGEGAETGSCLKDALAKKNAVEKAKADSRFINNGNGTVLDTRTNLMWAAKDNGSNIKWPDAKSYCANYRGGGYSDWRMPTSSELAGLYDAKKEIPVACNKSYSINVATDLIDITCYYLWASETRDNLVGVSNAAYFYFMGGGQYWTRQSYDDTYRILPVRSGK